MNLADLFAILFVILGFLIVYVGYWLAAYALFPGQTHRCASQLERAPIKTTLVGAVTLVPLVLIGLKISSVAPNGAGKIAGLALALITLLTALFGSAGLALRIGEGLKTTRDESEPWRKVLRGGTVLGLTFVLPFIGWFGVMPLVFISGFGAMLLARPRRSAQAEAALHIPPLPGEAVIEERQSATTVP